MAVLPPALHKLPSVRRICLWPIQPAGFPFPGRSIALQVTEMSVRSLARPFQPDNPRRIRSLGPRCLAKCFKRSAAPWPRLIRQHFPLRGRFPPLPRPPSRRICAAVSGPPFAFASAFRTWFTNDVERHPARLPRSRMRPDRGRKSEASSWLIRERLRRVRPNASPNPRTLCHGV
jgi:hypothetical protein